MKKLTLVSAFVWIFSVCLPEVSVAGTVEESKESSSRLPPNSEPTKESALSRKERLKSEKARKDHERYLLMMDRSKK